MACLSSPYFKCDEVKTKLNYRCVVCNSIDSFPCLQCNRVYYCEQHRNGDWPRHKEECKLPDIDTTMEIFQEIVYVTFDPEHLEKCGCGADVIEDLQRSAAYQWSPMAIGGDDYGFDLTDNVAKNFVEIAKRKGFDPVEIMEKKDLPPPYFQLLEKLQIMQLDGMDGTELPTG